MQLPAVDLPWPGMVRVLNIVEGASGTNSNGYPGS